MSVTTGIAPLSHEEYPLAPRHPIWRLIVNAFVCFHIFAILIWNMPSSYVQSTLHSRLWTYMNYMGVSQGWGMFAPDPGHDNAYMAARITYSDGKMRVVEMGRMDNQGNWFRLVHERDRKMIENLYSPATGKPYYPQMSLWMARKNNVLKNDPPVKVELLRYWCFIPPPPEGINDPILQNWHSDIVFSTPIRMEAKK